MSSDSETTPPELVQLFWNKSKEVAGGSKRPLNLAGLHTIEPPDRNPLEMLSLATAIETKIVVLCSWGIGQLSFLELKPN